MKKTVLINSSISYAISKMGHGNTITIADAGLPIPDQVERIDVAVSENNPDFMSTLNAVLSELKLEKVIIAEEMRSHNAKIYQYIQSILNDIDLVFVSHEEFKKMTESTKAVIRTGEFSPYANIILVSGVVF